MRRSLGSLIAALLVVAGLSAASPNPAAGALPAAEPHLTPQHGVYRGRGDNTDFHVAFTFGGERSDTLAHFFLNDMVVGGAHVSRDGAWEETCHDRICIRGHWITDTFVAGAVRLGDNPWLGFHAEFNPPNHLREGRYVAERSPSVRFSYREGRIVGFTVGGQLFGDAEVHSHTFNVCHRHLCFRGHWQEPTVVVGSSNSGGGSHTAWRHFEAELRP